MCGGGGGGGGRERERVNLSMCNWVCVYTVYKRDTQIDCRVYVCNICQILRSLFFYICVENVWRPVFSCLDLIVNVIKLISLYCNLELNTKRSQLLYIHFSVLNY